MSEQGFMYGSVYEFVEQFVAVMYPTTSTRVKDVRWSRQWWRHEEAVTRLGAMWHRFEQLRKEEPGTYVETFLRTCGDYHMGVLQRPGGVFEDCRREDTPSVPLPMEEMVPVTAEYENQAW